MRTPVTGEGRFIQGYGDIWICRDKTSKRNGDFHIEELRSNGGEVLNKPFWDVLLHSSQNTGQVLLMIEVVKRPEPTSHKLTSMSHCARAELLSNSKSAVHVSIVSIGCLYLIINGLYLAADGAAQI